MRPVVRFDMAGLRYDEGPDVFSDVSLTLEPGSFHFLTGHSGAGKTSLLKLIYLAQKPTSGLVTVFDQDVTAIPATSIPDLRRKVGVVFQDFRLLDHLDVFENVALPLRVRGVPRGEYQDDVRDLIEWVGLGDRANAPPPTLSAGEKQRVAIARAVVGKPALLLADEPTGNVDPEMGRRLMRLFVELNRLGGSVLIATHDREMVDSVDAPRLHLEAGRLDRIGA